ncbi:hypothetical protein NQ318_013141 [Aromia moschata]|uniref:Uncharacterized protein n=1 Tax=Aromia moschata TaxID=1265417 RepID=A0AAV8Y1C6_9CUCU|nr:hypothetical protein NQ318_013141 [Aromia moschata]
MKEVDNFAKHTRLGNSEKVTAHTSPASAWWEARFFLIDGRRTFTHIFIGNVIVQRTEVILQDK